MMTLLTSASCKKTSTQQQLPPETHEGKFTFGCKVDGKIYTASGKDGLLTSQYVSYGLISSDSSIYISARNTNNPNFGLTMKIHYLGQIDSYIMKTYPYEGKFSDNSNGSIPGSSNTFTTTDNYNGSINIKYFNGSYSPYKEGTILSGTFEMEAINGEGKVIHITEGRFDIGQ
jgi:hypothetical protein